MKQALQGKTAFVTGGTGGIGAAICTRFATEGASVIAADLQQAGNPAAGVEFVEFDVTREDGIVTTFADLEKRWHKIDVLVNALGDSIRTPLVGLPDGEGAGEAISDADLDFIIDINLTEALLCTRAVGPHMLARRSGKVINISSWTGRQGGGEMVLYTAAKSALEGFTRAQALEWAPYGIQVNCIAPGLFPDIMTGGEARMRRSVERAKTDVPLGRVGELREVGFLALYLASSASDYMTGQMILLDGGLGL